MFIKLCYHFPFCFLSGYLPTDSAHNGTQGVREGSQRGSTGQQKQSPPSYLTGRPKQPRARGFSEVGHPSPDYWLCQSNKRKKRTWGQGVGSWGLGSEKPSSTLSSPTQGEGPKVRADQMSSGNRVSTYAQTIAVCPNKSGARNSSCKLEGRLPHAINYVTVTSLDKTESSAGASGHTRLQYHHQSFYTL